MRLRVNELMSKGGGAKKVNIRKWFSNTNCTIMYATVRCTLICTLNGLKRHLSFLWLVHTVYDALLNYAFPFLISFFHQIFRKIFIFAKAFAPMAQQSHFFYWEIHSLVAKVHTNYQHNRLTNWQDLHNYSENDSWYIVYLALQPWGENVGVKVQKWSSWPVFGFSRFRERKYTALILSKTYCIIISVFSIFSTIYSICLCKG